MALPIASRDNEKVKFAAKLLSDGALRKSSGLIVLEGPKLIAETAVANLQIVELFYTQKALEAHPFLGELQGEHYIVQEHVAQKLSSAQTPQGALAVCSAPVFEQNLKTGGRYVALEHVQDPANLGAVLRTAAALGFDGAFVTPQCADVYSPKVLRASMGACLKLPVFVKQNLAETLTALATQGFLTLAADMHNAVSLPDISPRGGVVIVLGNEGQGLSDAVINACGQTVSIPMGADTESLNVAAAAAIIMWHFRGL